ncbi:IS200/IS605 family transposase, partial [Coprococcus sp. AM25-15LB]
MLFHFIHVIISYNLNHLYPVVTGSIADDVKQ